MNSTIATPAATLIEACIQASSDRITATGSKGASLTAAHAVLDVPGAHASVHKEAGSLLESHGGIKNAPKHIAGGYKLAKRYAACAEFLEKVGLSFTAIGEVISEKRTFSINQCEAYTRSNSDDAVVKAAAVAFQSAKGVLVTRVALADAAGESAANEAKAEAMREFKNKLRAELMAELKSQGEVKPKAKVKA